RALKFRIQRIFWVISQIVSCSTGQKLMRRSQRAATVNVDESAGRRKAGIDFDAEDRIAGGLGFEGMGHNRQQLCAVRQDSRLSAGQSAAGGDRQTISQGNSGRSDKEARLEELSGGDRAEKIAGG